MERVIANTALDKDFKHHINFRQFDLITREDPADKVGPKGQQSLGVQ